MYCHKHCHAWLQPYNRLPIKEGLKRDLCRWLVLHVSKATFYQHADKLNSQDNTHLRLLHVSPLHKYICHTMGKDLKVQRTDDDTVQTIYAKIDFYQGQLVSHQRIQTTIYDIDWTIAIEATAKQDTGKNGINDLDINCCRIPCRFLKVCSGNAQSTTIK